ncbi:MAG: pectin acetylesterase-family hydrolase [Anaerolineae bacterium]
MRKPVIISLILLLLGASLPAQAQDWTPVTPVTPGGDAVCARGTPYTFFVRSGDPAKLVIFFEGGGACWNDATCAPGSGLFDEVVEGGEAGAYSQGIFDAANPENPLAGYTIVFVAYCTGDYHLGTQQ